MGKAQITKTCTQCGETKEAVPNNFGRIYAGRDDRLKNICNPCLTAYSKAWYEKKRGRQLLKVYARFDKERGLAFDLDEEWFFLTIEDKPCHYCGMVEDRMGVDRLDNSVGHTKNNCVPCCQTCNRVRLDVFSPEEMKLIGAVIRKIKQDRAHDAEHDSITTPIGRFGHRR